MDNISPCLTRSLAGGPIGSSPVLSHLIMMIPSQWKTSGRDIRSRPTSEDYKNKQLVILCNIPIMICIMTVLKPKMMIALNGNEIESDDNN